MTSYTLQLNHDSGVSIGHVFIQNGEGNNQNTCHFFNENICIRSQSRRQRSHYHVIKDRTIGIVDMSILRVRSGTRTTESHAIQMPLYVHTWHGLTHLRPHAHTDSRHFGGYKGRRI